MGGECLGVATTFVGVDAFERQDLGAGHLVHVGLTGDPGLAIDDDRAAAALAGRGATVFGREHAELVAEGGEQMLVRVGGYGGYTVEEELGHDVAPRVVGGGVVGRLSGVGPSDGSITPFWVVMRW